MLSHSEAFWLQFTTIAVALISPIVAVILTIWYQAREAKYRAKLNIFMDLVSFRHHVPVPWQFFVALNRIDVVFHKQEAICHLYHEYYDLTLRDLTGVDGVLLNEKKVALITEMARHLGYNQIDQIYLQRYYQPKGGYDDYLGDIELKTTAYQYFLSGKDMNTRVIARMDAEQEEGDPK